MDKFQILDISGDVGIRAFGKSIEEAFINAALGMYSLITNIDEIEKKKTIIVTPESYSLEGLIVSWLNELVFHFDTYGFIGKEIEITEIGGLSKGEDYNLKASIYGEEFDSERHEKKLLIKAATYHKIRLEKTDGIWEINVIFDI